MRWVVTLGTGTNVGKTHVSCALTRALIAQGVPAGAVKPIETGSDGEDSDAARLARAGTSFNAPEPHPLLHFDEPISPHLAAARSGRNIELGAIVRWLGAWERRAHQENSANGCCLVETAGGVFSPLGRGVTNFTLASALEPAFWLLVAPDRLGVLHDVTATLRAMEALGRMPDALVLTAAGPPDASRGSNAEELRRLGIADPIATLAHGDDGDAALSALVTRITQA